MASVLEQELERARARGPLLVAPPEERALLASKLLTRACTWCRVGIGTVILIVLIRAHWSGSPPPVTTIGAAGGRSSAVASLPNLDHGGPSQPEDEEESSRQAAAEPAPKSRLPKPGVSSEAGEEGSASEETADADEEEQEAVVEEVKAKEAGGKLPAKKAGKKGGATLSVGLAEPSEECHVEVTAQYKGQILSKRHEESAAACRQSCRDTKSCNAWTYCFDYNKCPNVEGEELERYTCQLAAEPMSPWGLPDPALAGLLQPSSYYAGYIKLRDAEQRTFIRMHSQPTPRVVLATGLVPRTQGCPAKDGNLRALLSVLNKQDYARWHSYDFVLSTSTPGSIPAPSRAQTGPWNLLGEVVDILNWTTPEEAEWILYIAADSMIDDITFALPFESYHHYNLVLVGDETKTLEGDARYVDAGVMLFRNCEWTRNLLGSLTERVRNSDPPPPEEAHKSDPVAQTLVGHLVEHRDELLPYVRFESDFCLACDWRKINLTESSKVDKSKKWGEENKRWKLYISRFFDCQYCEGYGMTEEALDTCHASWLEHFEFAYCRFHRNELARERGRQLGTPLDHVQELADSPPKAMLDLGMTPPPLYDFKAHSVPRQRNPVLAAAADFSTPTGQACWEACMAEPKCEMWVWCDHVGGCDDSGDWSGRYPHHGCELMELPTGRDISSWDRGPFFSTFESGYITGKHPGRNRTAGSPLPSAKERAVLLVGMSSTPCTTPWGDLLLEIQLKNKADWARLHGYELHLMAETIDPNTRPGAWQKTSMLKRALHKIPRNRSEWLVWMDMDTIIGNMAFTFPYKAYTGKDLVLWGEADKIKKGDTQGMNSGVMVMRNNKWMRKLMDEIGKYGEYPVDWSIEQKLRDALPSYDIGMYEQNALTYIFKQDPELMDEHVVLDNKSGLNVWYKNLYNEDVVQPAFVVHFAGCQLCTGFHPERLGVCDNEFVRNFAEATYRLQREVDRHHMLR